MEKLVVGIDSSTQSTKAISWTRNGTSEAEGRSPISIQNPGLNRYEQSCESWWESCQRALWDLTQQIDPDRIVGVAISNQRETVAFIDEKGEEVRPGIVWLDERAIQQLQDFSTLVGEDTIHNITGRPVDIIPVIYRLAWLKVHETETFNKTAYFTDVQGYLVHKLSGHLRTSWSSADPMGYFDIRKKEYSPVLLKALGLTCERFPKTFAPGSLLGEVTDEASKKTGLAVGTPIYAGGGDGQCASLGVNCVDPWHAYINLGTAVVSGVWSSDCITNKAWRTEIAASGDGYIFETVLRSGIFLTNWFADNFLPGDRSAADFFSNLEDKVGKLPIGSEGLITLPYWSGVMNPHWNPNARGCFIGLSPGHTPIHMYRSIIEGICLYQAHATNLAEEATGEQILRYTAIGGGASSLLWTQMLADCTGREVALSKSQEASSLGAAMLAGHGAGWFDTIGEAAEKMQTITKVLVPNQKHLKIWKSLLSISSQIYDNNKEIFEQLATFNKNYNQKEHI